MSGSSTRSNEEMADDIPDPRTPLIDRTRQWNPDPGSMVRVRAVFYQADDQEDFLFGFLRVTIHPNSLVVYTSEGNILTRDSLVNVVRVLTIPEGLPIIFDEDFQTLHAVVDTPIEDDENLGIMFRIRLQEPNDQYIVRLRDIGISQNTMRFIQSFEDGQIAKIVNLDNPWPSME